MTQTTSVIGTRDPFPDLTAWEDSTALQFVKSPPTPQTSSLYQVHESVLIYLFFSSSMYVLYNSVFKPKCIFNLYSKCTVLYLLTFKNLVLQQPKFNWGLHHNRLRLYSVTRKCMVNVFALVPSSACSKNTNKKCEEKEGVCKRKCSNKEKMIRNGCSNEDGRICVCCAKQGDE